MQVFLDYVENTKEQWKLLFEEYDQKLEQNKAKILSKDI